MRRQALLFKILGSGWLTLGVICLALGSLQVSGLDWNGLMAQALSTEVNMLWQSFYHPLIMLVFLVWGGVCIVLGWNLIRLMSWAKPLAQTMHMLLVVYLVAALTVGFAVAPQERGALAFVILLLAINLALAYLLRGRLAGEVFSQIPLRTAPVIARRCEFCGGSLDPQTGRCLDCEPAIRANHRVDSRQRPKPALMAQLVSLDDDTVYPLSPQQPTFVGRELSRNDINLSNPTVSRQHACIEYDAQNSHYILIAMQDSNGTFVNDGLMRRRPLRDGDEVRFGRARFRFRIVSGMEITGG